MEKINTKASALLGEHDAVDKQLLCQTENKLFNISLIGNSEFEDIIK